MPETKDMQISEAECLRLSKVLDVRALPAYSSASERYAPPPLGTAVVWTCFTVPMVPEGAARGGGGRFGDLIRARARPRETGSSRFNLLLDHPSAAWFPPPLGCVQGLRGKEREVEGGVGGRVAQGPHARESRAAATSIDVFEAISLSNLRGSGAPIRMTP